MHEPRYRDWNWVESDWFSFLIPEERLCGHMRALMPPVEVSESKVARASEVRIGGRHWGVAEPRDWLRARSR